MTKDLVVLVPDKDIEQAVRGLLGRPQAIGIRQVEFAIAVHPHRDPGCFNTADQLLEPYRPECAHALVVFDWAWQGTPADTAAELAALVETKLRAVWGDRCRCIVIDPEIEAWVWSDSPNVETALGWEGRDPGLRGWLAEQGLWPAAQAKPTDPKQAFEKALWEVRLPPSASVFGRLAATVSFQRCQDPMFQALLNVLRAWFPA